MFLLNRGYSTKIDSKLSLKGFILSASALQMPNIERRSLPNSDIRLFDPQMYFPIDLNKSCSNTFNKLATYPWFNPNNPSFDSTQINLKDFAKIIQDNKLYQNISLPKTDDDLNIRIRNCINFQVSLNVSHIILPTTLVTDAEDEFSEQLKWINNGINLSSDCKIPKLITIAISDNLIINKSYEKNLLLQTILDNLTAFNEIDGFYLVISRGSSSINITEKYLVQTILEFSYILGHKMGKEVFLNFDDTLGFLALSVGASYFGSGYTNKEKRLNFDDFYDSQSGGAPLPHFYSHSLIGDLFSDRDLTKLKKANLLDFIEPDNTQFSESLIQYLKNDMPISQNQEWKETRNNVTTAKLHRIDLLSKKAQEMSSMTFKEKIEITKRWLLSADINCNYIKERFKSDPITEDFRHVSVWRECYDKFLEKYSL